MKIISKKNSMLPKKKTKKRKLLWGVTGCGKFLEEAFLPTLQILPRSKLISVHSSNADRAKTIATKFYAEKSFSNYDEFLKSDFDALYISSVNSAHYEQVIKAAEAGKHILCEKPLTVDSKLAEKMVAACEKNGVKLLINYTHRFHPIVIKAKELIDKGLLGEIISVSASFNIDLPPSRNFRFKKELSGGGALWDLGTHMIDLMRYIAGEIIEIKGYTDNVIYKSEVEDFASGLVKFKKSGYGSFNVSYNNKIGSNRLEILGYNGAITIERLIGSGKGTTAKMIIDIDDEARKSFRRRANKQYHLLKDFQKSIFNKDYDFSAGWDAVSNIKLLEELEKSAE